MRRGRKPFLIPQILLVVRHPGVFIPDWNSEELEESLDRFGPDLGNDRWNFE
jgi:hypothetical protein